MKSSNREEIVDHDAKGLFDIVLDIESYPYFIPWCSAMRIHSKNKNEIYADMVVWYKYFMPQTFGSHVTFDKKKLSISKSSNLPVIIKKIEINTTPNRNS